MSQKPFNLLATFTLAFRSRKITTVLLIANICLLTLYVSGWSYGKQHITQQSQKLVLKHPAPKNEPIEIIETKAKTKALKLGEAFDDQADWLKHLTFKVKNRSDKAITFLEVDLDFPETKATAGAIMMHQLFFGQRPDFKSTLNNPPLYINPNETKEISLEAEYADIKTFIELKQPIETINKLTIRTSDIVFEDGTLFSGGIFYRRNSDPNSPQKWVQITDAQNVH